MDEFRKWKARVIQSWILFVVLIVGAKFLEGTGFFSMGLFSMLFVCFMALLFVSSFKACFAHCSNCDEYLVNPGHFWFGTVVFCNPKACKECGCV
jgi:hypothetical protein